MESNFHKKIKHILKHNVFVLSMYKVIVSAIFRFIGLFVRIDNNTILFTSYGGEKYNDSPRVLYESMKSDNRFKNFHFVWAFVDPGAFDVDGAEKIRIDTLKYFLTAIKAKIWITNVNIERGLSFKKKGTIYLNTWHGTGPKKSGNAIKSRNDYDFSNVDILCCDGDYLKNIFVNYFNASEQSLLMCGRPREDELFTFTEVDRIAIRDELKIPENKKIILYMPTWRDYRHNLPDFHFWKDKLGENYVVLCRIHHFNNDEISEDKLNDFLIDVTDYDDVNRLYYVSDILISDYSSAFFDFGLLGKPIICFADDYQKYCETTGLFMNLEKEFPGGVIKDETALISKIVSISSEKDGAIAKIFVNRYLSRNGNSTKLCLDRVNTILQNEK